MKIPTLVTRFAVALMLIATTTYGQRPAQRPQIPGTAGAGGGIRPCPALQSPGSCSPGPSVNVARYIPPPNNAQSGAVRLKFRPATAAVYVDDRYAGRVHEFDGDSERLVLSTGSHLIVIHALGHETLEIETRTRAGETSIYRGTLSPLLRCHDGPCRSAK